MKIVYTCCSFLLIIISGTMLSCSETKDATPLTFTKKFTGDDHKSWVPQYIQYKQAGKSDEKFSFYPCELDDIYTFYAGPDRRYTVDDHNTTCTTSGSSYSVNDTWSYNTARATLNIILPPFSDNTLSFFIRSVSDNQLVLEIFLDQANTSSYRVYFASTNK